MNKSEVPTRMAYWLVPSEPWLQSLQKTANELATRFDGPDFEPHVTIYFGAFDSRDPVSDILDSLEDFGEVELITKSLLFGDKFTQSCFIEFESSLVLSQMNQIVSSQIYQRENYSAVPHLSLFYGALALGERRDVENNITLPKLVKFNLVKVIANPPKVASKRDVEFWNERARRFLRP